MTVNMGMMEGSAEFWSTRSRSQTDGDNNCTSSIRQLNLSPINAARLTMVNRVPVEPRYTEVTQKASRPSTTPTTTNSKAVGHQKAGSALPQT